MASTLRSALLRHFRVSLAPTRPNSDPLGSILRFMSWDHDDDRAKEEVVDRVLDVVKSFPNVYPSKVTPDVHFQKDLGLDSLDNVEIVMALEEEFKLEIPERKLIRSTPAILLLMMFITIHCLADLLRLSLLQCYARLLLSLFFFVRFDCNVSMNLITKDL